MYQRGGVHVGERLERLVHDVLLMDLFQDIGPDGRVQVCLHVLEDKVEILIVVGFDDAVQFDNVFVVHLEQVDDLAVGALRVRRILEGVEDLLERDLLLGLLLQRLPHNAVRPLPQLLLHLEPARHVLIDVVAHSSSCRRGQAPSRLANPISSVLAKSRGGERLSSAQWNASVNT